jgi:hypothetical protein
VILKLQSVEESLTWKTTVFFHDFAAAEDETVILGHLGFLEYFTAVFDGKLATLALTPNDELPTIE